MGGGNSGHIGSNSSTYRQTCSLCGGKGWIAGSKTPTYGNSGTHWCSECGKTVNHPIATTVVLHVAEKGIIIKLNK